MENYQIPEDDKTETLDLEEITAKCSAEKLSTLEMPVDEFMHLKKPIKWGHIYDEFEKQK